MRLSRRKRKTILYTICAVVVIVFCVVFGMQMIKQHRKNVEAEQRNIRLEQLLKEQEDRVQELADAEVYTKTKKFIEEKAKSIGYIYPDEIIFKKDK